MSVEIDALKREISEGFTHVNKKLDLLLDPKTGVFTELRDINNRAEKAHERIDVQEKSIEKIKYQLYGDLNTAGYEAIIKENKTAIDDLRKHRENTVKSLKKAFWITIGPILFGIGSAIFAILSGGN